MSAFGGKADIDQPLLIDIHAAKAAAAVICKTHALRVTGANAPWGRNYSREFSVEAVLFGSPSSYIRTPRRLKRGGQRCRSGKGDG
jgi:hypothetical protein